MSDTDNMNTSLDTPQPSSLRMAVRFWWSNIWRQILVNMAILFFLNLLVMSFYLIKGEDISTTALLLAFLGNMILSIPVQIWVMEKMLIQYGFWKK